MANPFVHIELNTDNLKGSQKFYSKLFKWKLSGAPGGMPYTMIDTGSKATGGGMQAKPMPEAPTAWLPYVEVKDVKTTIAQAKKLGAKIALEYQEIGEMGAIGVLIDPAGAALGVWAQKKKGRR